ncbi:hypothetical protein EAE99_008575 [Botrytis elliptica]|nr:hypothetical protein EAE99_008575 [Botrytis elliptica]
MEHENRRRDLAMTAKDNKLFQFRGMRAKNIAQNGEDPGAILLEAQKINFELKDSDPVAAFKRKYDGILLGRSGINMLDELARTSTWESKQQPKLFLDWILENYPELLEKLNAEGYGPFQKALLERNDDFVEAVLENPALKNLGTAFKLSSNKGNAIHIAVEKMYHATHDILKKCKDPRSMLKQKNGDGNTPLHIAVSISEYDVYSVRTVLRQHHLIPNESTSASTTEPSTEPNSRLPRVETNRHTGNQSRSDEQLSQKEISGIDRPLNDETTSYELGLQWLYSIVQLLVDTCPDTLEYKNKALRTPYQEREDTIRSLDMIDQVLKEVKATSGSRSDVELREEAIRCILIEDYIGSHIRSHCMHNFSRDKIMTCLYYPGNEKHIEFDLAGIPSVKSIIKVMVIDDGDPSHADSAIEGALCGFKVEIWDWKKIDICSDVIANSTKTVKDISLYCSGNKAVLMGWTSPHGFLNSEKFPLLRNIKLFIREGQEDSEQLEKYINWFKEEVNSAKEHMKHEIKVEVTLDNMEVSFASEFQNTEGSMEIGNKWVDCMKDFAKFIGSIAEGKKSPIKIAVIDDGVDSSFDIFDRKIATGQSFCPHPNSADLMNSYFIPSGQHGTRMAMLILQICPNAKLYIARLDEHRKPDGDGKRQITTKSAAEAIQWAVDCGVDIISMSWSLEEQKPQSDAMKKLESAITEAQLKDILMFCSASDQGNSATNESFPGATNKCIRIGAATDTGRRLPWVVEDVDFLFPGKEIPFEDHDNKIVRESGSSVATAAATGLAAVLINCTKIVGESEDNGYYFRQKRNIEKAFKQLSQQLSYGTPKEYYPLVDLFFEKKFCKYLASAHGNTRKKTPISIPEQDWDDVSKEALRKLMNEIKGERYD